MPKPPPRVQPTVHSPRVPTSLPTSPPSAQPKTLFPTMAGYEEKHRAILPYKPTSTPPKKALSISTNSQSWHPRSHTRTQRRPISQHSQQSPDTHHHTRGNTGLHQQTSQATSSHHVARHTDSSPPRCYRPSLTNPQANSWKCVTSSSTLSTKNSGAICAQRNLPV